MKKVKEGIEQNEKTYQVDLENVWSRMREGI